MENEKTSPFQEGKTASRHGEAANSNPYGQDTGEYVEWWEGFQFIDDQKDAEIRSKMLEKSP